MKFSIIVPIYRVESYLDKCVESLVSQSEKDIEIILVDDGSPDACPQMCDGWALRDERIKVIHKENGGLSDARNAGIEAASGDYILFVDSDDYITEDACERLIAFAGDGVDILVGDLETIGGANYYQHNQALLGKVLSSEEFLIASLKANRLPAPAPLNAYRKELFADGSLRFKVGLLHEDEHFMPRAFLAAKTVVYTGVSFYRYVIREESITTKKDKRKNAQHIFLICDELESIYKSIENKTLKRLLLNRLSDLCLSIHYSWELSKYGKEYIRKRFIWRNAHTFKIKLLAFIYCISPKLLSALMK